MKMMNFVGLGFMLSSLVTAVVWSPELPQKHQSMGVATVKAGEEKPREVLMREGRRIIVVEYEREEPLESAAGTANQYAQATGENVRHAASQVLNKVEDAGDEALHLVKTGADKTKDSVKANAGKAKDTVKTAADKTSHAVKGAASSALHAAGTVKDRAEEAVKDQAYHTYDKTGEVYESAKDKVSQTLGSVKDRAEEAVKNQAHDTYDKTGQLYESAKDKVSQTLGSVKDAGAGVKEAVPSHLPDIRQAVKPGGNAEDSKDAKTSGVGVGETLKDACKRLADKFTGSKKEAENVDSYKKKIAEIFDSAKEKASKSGDDLFGGAFNKESSEHMAGDVYGSAKGKIPDVEDKMKEKGEQALKTAGETYDSAKESMKKAGDYVHRTAEDAGGSSRVKEHEEEQHVGLKLNAGEAGILYKFRQAVDEVCRLSPELLEAAGKLEKQVLPLLSTDDTKDGTRVRTANLVNDSVANLTTATGEFSKGFFSILPSRFCRWASKEALTVLRLVHLLAFATVYGSSIWVNFIGGHVLARTIPRQQFGFIQSKLYPVYFNTLACGLAICLLAHSAVHPWRSPSKAERFEDYNLIFSLLLTLVNMLYFEPQATEALFEKLKIEKEEGRGIDLGDTNINADNLSMNTTTTTNDLHVHSSSRLVGDDVNCKLAKVNKRLKVLHLYSSTFNMLCLASLTWHLAYLSSHLKI